MGDGRNVCRVLVGKPEGKRPLERPRSRWEDGIKMDFKEIGWGGVEWIHLAQDRDRWRAVVNAVMNLRLLAPPNLYLTSTEHEKRVSKRKRFKFCEVGTKLHINCVEIGISRDVN
jgi:hypothetical protein